MQALKQVAISRVDVERRAIPDQRRNGWAVFGTRRAEGQRGDLIGFAGWRIQGLFGGWPFLFIDRYYFVSRSLFSHDWLGLSPQQAEYKPFLPIFQPIMPKIPDSRGFLPIFPSVFEGL
jgi:hypothetical protein